jgi:hypothetical protein
MVDGSSPNLSLSREDGVDAFERYNTFPLETKLYLAKNSSFILRKADNITSPSI